MTDSRSLPDGLVESARAYARGQLVPVEPRPAATVVLLRDVPGGDGGSAPEAYLIRRVATMAFTCGGRLASRRAS